METVIFFLQVGVLSPLGRNFYLNITPNNLVHLYLRADAVPEGSPTSVRIRELSSKDWETTACETTKFLCSNSCLANIRPPVSCSINGRISTDCAAVRPENHQNLARNPMQKQSLTELVTSLRNSGSARIQAPNQACLSLSSARGSTAHSFSPLSSDSNLSELDFLRHVQNTSSRLNSRANVTESSPRYSPHPDACHRPSNMLDSQCSLTPGQATGAKFRFKRNPSTPLPSQVQSSVSGEQMSAAHWQRSASGITASSINQPRSVVSPSVGKATATTSTTAADLWGTGKQSVPLSLWYPWKPVLSAFLLLVGQQEGHAAVKNCVPMIPEGSFVWDLWLIQPSMEWTGKAKTRWTS